MSDTAQQHIEGNTDSGLPEGWTLAKLGDLCTHPQYGWTTSANRNGTGLKLLRTTDISGGTVNWSTVPACARDPDDPQKYLLAPGDILVSRAGSVGLSHLVKDCPEAIFASYLIRFRPKPPSMSEFIALYLKSPQYWAAIADETAGIAIPNVNASKLKQIGVPLPPLAEQKRIVAKVEQLIARVKATKERLAKASMILKRFRQAVLSAACSGHLTADWREKNHSRKSGEDLLELILNEKELSGKKTRIETDKHNSSEDKEPFDLPTTWAWATIGQITKNFDGERIPVKADDRKRRKGRYDYYGASGIIDSIDDYLFDGEFLLIAEDGANLLSRSTPITFRASGKFWVNNHAHIVQTYGDIPLQYLEGYLNSIDLQHYVTGSAQPKLTQEAMNRIPVPLPPNGEQQEIVRRVEGLFKLADGIEKRVAAATLRAEKITQSILAKAFRGELVPTEAELARREGRSYEPASELLPRIKSDGESKGGSKSVNRIRRSQRRLK